MLKHPQKKKAAFRRPKPVISRHCSSLSNALPNSVAVPEKVLEANRGCSIIPYSSESSVSGDEKEITKKPTPTPSKSNGGSILTYLNGNLGDGDCASAGDMVSFFFVVKKIDGTVLDSVAIESDVRFLAQVLERSYRLTHSSSSVLYPHLPAITSGIGFLALSA